MAPSGRKSTAHRESLVAQNKMRTTLDEAIAIPGTPDAISSGGFVGSGHMSSKYITLVRGTGNSGTDEVWVPMKLRITLIGRETSAKDMILYAFSTLPTTTPANLTWRVLFADAMQQTVGDYFDIDLPDSTFYPHTYLALLLVNGAWDGRTIEDASKKICSVSGTQSYYCLNQSYSNSDVGDAHAVCIQGYSTQSGTQTCMCIGFEDWAMSTTDKDYNDVVLAICDYFTDDAHTNDTTLS